MPPIRARRQFMMAIEKVLREKNDDIPDIVMIDEHIDMLIAQGNLQLAQNNKAPSNQEDEVSNRIQQNVSDTPDFVLKDIGNDKHKEVPLELRAIIQAEEQRAAQMTANLKSCTLAINGVQMALSTSALDRNKEFNEGLLTYLRAAIAQFLANGTGISPPSTPAET
ncbi:putative eka-like protein [Golovinomyces cichoracearum]|uniref:Putative eka-like protein n=1 Tax=Golovinomyces cichoracearum TaxID=62708 RepID=A0A420IRL5_9PEZI|nr:putative eka-like protein [Golovinomyces cichoracearum]